MPCVRELQWCPMDRRLNGAYARAADDTGDLTGATIEWAEDRLVRILEMPFDPKTVKAQDHIAAFKLLGELKGWSRPQRQGVVEVQSVRPIATAADQVAAIRLLAEMKGWIPPSVKS
jgi:hypothetical protein